jgi:hypothetical protein
VRNNFFFNFLISTEIVPSAELVTHTKKKKQINAKKTVDQVPQSPPTMDQPEKKKAAAEALKTPTTRLQAQQNPGESKPKISLSISPAKKIFTTY